jgi:hypothetical protein
VSGARDWEIRGGAAASERMLGGGRVGRAGMVMPVSLVREVEGVTIMEARLFGRGGKIGPERKLGE